MFSKPLLTPRQPSNTFYPRIPAIQNCWKRFCRACVIALDKKDDVSRIRWEKRGWSPQSSIPEAKDDVSSKFVRAIRAGAKENQAFTFAGRFRPRGTFCLFLKFVVVRHLIGSKLLRALVNESVTEVAWFRVNYRPHNHPIIRSHWTSAGTVETQLNIVTDLFVS